MKKRRLEIIIIASMLLLGCNSTEIKKENTVKSSEKISEVKKVEENTKNIEEKKEDENDFRNARWGVSQQEITKLEIEKDIFDIPDINSIGFYEEIAGINFLVIYEFEDNKFVKGVYSVLGKDVTEQNHLKIRDVLIEKHGNPDIEKHDEVAFKMMEWNKSRSIIKYSTDFENSKIIVEYTDINYYNKQKNKAGTAVEKDKIEGKLF